MDGNEPVGRAARYAALSTGAVDFVERHQLWSAEQQAAAAEMSAGLGSVDLVRVAFGDPHGLVRSKTLTSAACRTALRNGMDFSPGPFVFDTGHAVAVDFFAAGGGIGVPELTGAGDFILVPDPRTFRVLGHGPARVGWVIGDEFLRSGAPHPLSTRRALRELLAGAAERGYDYVVGLEVEWYLTRLSHPAWTGRIGGFGVQGEPPEVTPVDGGYQFNSDALMAALLPVLEPLATALLALGLPLRSLEHESGPGQLEFTFSPMDGLAAADAMLLFRSVAKQTCAARGYHASFMALPGIGGFDPSGWHLHQSLFDRSTGRNAFTPAAERPGAPLAPPGLGYLAGLLDHAAAVTLPAVPTVNGYRRLDEAFSLSPDRVGWSAENRGAFVRVLGGAGEDGTHLENRIGEPCANPYLYLASQLAAGLDGIDRALLPAPAATDPHAADARPLPRDLAEALTAFRDSALCRRVFGDPLVDCLGLLKQSELDRYREWLLKAEPAERASVVSAWEHREYFSAY